MVLLLEILTMCANFGDKVLVFSQNLSTLDLIELYLSKLPRPGKKGKLWKQGKDWFRCVYPFEDLKSWRVGYILCQISHIKSKLEVMFVIYNCTCFCMSVVQKYHCSFTNYIPVSMFPSLNFSCFYLFFRVHVCCFFHWGRGWIAFDLFPCFVASRLDGRTESSLRQKIVERFNEPLNRRVKCTLISTKAGSLGINLHAANRVIIVDGSWNPTYDLQAIYRVWRCALGRFLWD